MLPLLLASVRQPAWRRTPGDDVSGGSLDYAFRKVEAAAETLEDWKQDYGETHLPKLWLDFAAHLKIVAAALQAAEWELSCDTGEGPADEAIKKVLGDTEALKTCLRECIEVLHGEFGGCLASHGQPDHYCPDFCKAYHDACRLVGEEP